MLSDLLPPTAPEPARRAWLPFTFPSFNELEGARGRVSSIPGRASAAWNAYADLKRIYGQQAVLQLRRLKPIAGPLVVAFRFYERDRRRDPDGIASGAAKILLDALGPGRKGEKGWPGAGVIHCDGWHCLACPPVSTVELASEVPGARHSLGSVGVEVLIYEVRS